MTPSPVSPATEIERIAREEFVRLYHYSDESCDDIDDIDVQGSLAFGKAVATRCLRAFVGAVKAKAIEIEDPNDADPDAGNFALVGAFERVSKEWGISEPEP